jgi:hypothetical protein
MRQAKTFVDLHEALNFRLTRLDTLARNLATQSDVVKRREAGYLAIELHNLWSGFARAMFVSVMCGTRTLSGARAFPQAVPVCAKPTDAIGLATGRVAGSPHGGRRGRTRFDEPSWFDKAIYTRLAAQFAFNNLPAITSAFAIPTSFFDLVTVRNFFAHKNEGTAVKVARLGRRMYPTPPACPGKLLVDIVVPTNPPLVIEWIHDARTMGTLILR